jgi:hypothetical protein
MIRGRTTLMRLLLALLGVLLIVSLAVLTGDDLDDGGADDALSSSRPTHIVDQ